mmetsp:Transcript_20924/g.45752  ORF Transcript_20924/g.45752 Transcript_20924/m.45752 type:complete len:322 (-) Transcript_20924:305-1270(-)
MYRLEQLGWVLFSFALAAVIALRGLRRGSLSASGAWAAAFVGVLHMYCGMQYGLTLVFFYISSSKLTKLRSDVKARLEGDFKPNGQRGAVQVLANSLAGTACVLGLLLLPPQTAEGAHSMTQRFMVGAFLGHYACCCADTWASEVGILSPTPPVLITTLQLVPPGTNGAISALGSACSLAAGLAVSLVFLVASRLDHVLAAWSGAARVLPGTWAWWQVLGVGVVCGVVGCLLDSLLGATLQYSGYNQAEGKAVQHPGQGVRHVSGVPILSNSAVNLLASLGSAYLGGLLLSRAATSQPGHVQGLAAGGGAAWWSGTWATAM